MPDSASFAADCAASSSASASAQAASASAVLQRGRDQMLEHHALAFGGALARFGDAAVEFRQVGRGEARAVGHALAQRQLGIVAQFFHRGGGDFDDVAQLLVVLDLQAGDAIALRVVQLPLRQQLPAVVAKRALGIEFGVETAADDIAVVQPVRCGIGQRVGQLPAQCGIDRECGACRCGQSGHGTVERLGCRLRRCQSVAQCGEVARRTAIQRQPRQRAGDVGGAAQRGTETTGGVGIGDQPRPGVLPRGNRRRVGERRREPGRQRARAGRGERALHGGEQRVLGAAVARTLNLQAGAGGGVQAHHAGSALRRGAGEARHRAGLGAADVIQRQGGGDRLGVGEAAEGVQAGGAEGLRQAAAGDQRRRRHRFGRALVLPVAQLQGLRREDFRRLQAPEQGGKVGCGQCGGFEQAGGDVQPGSADAVAVLRQGRAAGWLCRLPAGLPR